MMNDELVIKIICIWVVVCSSVQGSDIDCTVDCACCVNRKCGLGNYFSDECTLGCIDGYAGARCYTKCPSTCKTCTAESGIATCTACHEGYFDLAGDCTSECLPTCKTCTLGSTCISCKDEYYNENGSKNCRYRKCSGNCKCENNQCTACMEGYYDTSNSCISSCKVNCVMCSSFASCKLCKDGYYNGHQYDDSSLPLKNDCSYSCRDNCVTCSSYEFCLVCKAGLYGRDCDKICSVGCISGICDKEAGHCSCGPFFAGDKCDRCQHGKYGDMCDTNCSLGCKDNECERNSGYCTKGCIVDTIIGDKCDVCQTATESSDPVNIAIIVLGIFLALSLAGYIIQAAICIHRKYRQRKSTRGPLYENSETELNCKSVPNLQESSSTAQVSSSNITASPRDYEDLSRIQVTEHEYGEIRTPA